MFNRKERRAIARGEGLVPMLAGRICYQPSPVSLSVEADISDALREEDDNHPCRCMPPERYDDLWVDHVPDHPDLYEEI